MINLLNSILFNAKRHENIGGGNSQVLHVEASNFTRIPSVARRSTDGESQRAYSVSMRSIRFAALLFLFFMVGAGNVWGSEQYIFPVTSASVGNGGTLSTDANGMWYYEMSDDGDYIDIPFTVDNSSRNYLIQIGYTTSSGGGLKLDFYKNGSYSSSFGEHGGLTISASIQEKNCGAQLRSANEMSDGLKAYAIRVKPFNGYAVKVYYLKIVSDDATVQSTANITTGLNFVATSTTGDQIVNNSDFLYSHKKEARVKTQNKGGYDRTTFTNGYVTAASRKLYTFETGTYKFTFDVFTEENNTYNKPYVFVNNVVAGGGSYNFNKDDGSAGGNYRNWEVEIDVTEGTYPIAFFFPNSNEKLFYRLASVEKKAASCSNYSFHYGTNNQSDWTVACFENGNETDERVITDFTIPTVPDFWVGWQGNPLANNMTELHSWNDNVSDLGNGVMNGAMLLLPVGGTSKVGWAQGAVGTLRCWYGSTSKNQYVGFLPNGYGITYGGNSYAFSTTATANMLETDVVTLPNVSTTYTMGIETATEGTYVTCAHSSAAEAISNMGVTVVSGGKKAIYLVPGSFNEAGAKYAVYDVTSGEFDTDFMSDSDGDGIYVGYVGSNCSTMILCRMNSDATTTDLANNNWEKRWNQTANIGISGDLAKKYTITNMNTWNACAYTTANMQPITGQKGKFRMWANSSSNNWYVHWIPYYVLSYDANGGSGSTTQTERNSESSTTTVTVASNSFTAPTGKHFIGWAISQANADAGTVDYAAGASYTLTSNATLYAVWAWDTYTITYNAGTGVITGSHANDTKTYGVNLTLPGATFSKTGYTQTGWATTDGGSQAYSLSGSYTENAAADLYPVWTAKTTTITIDANTANNGSTTPGTVTATWGSVLPSFTAASGAVGYDLDGYYTAATGGTKIINADGTLVASTAYTTADSKWNSESGSVTLYAQYELALSYCDFATGHENNANFGDANGRCLISIEPTGNTNEYQLTLKPNYANGATKKLDYLYVEGSGNSPYPAVVNYESASGAYDELSVTFTNSNSSVSLMIQWSHPDWDGRWQCTPNVIFSKVVACDHNVIYSAPSNGSYTIQVGDGVASGADKTAATGETITLEATPSSGYTFGGWTIKTSDGTDVTASVGLSGTSTETFTMPAYDVTVAATFEVDPCTNSKTIQCTSGYVPVTTHNADPYTENKHETYVVTTYNVSAYYYPLSLSSALSTFSLSIHMANSQNDYAWWNIYKKTDNNSGDVEYAGAFYNKVGWQHMVASGSWNSGEFDDAITSFNDGQQGVGSSIPAGDYLIGLSAKNDAKFYYFTLTASENIFCAAPTYDVTITGSPAAGQASATGDGSYEEGETVTINATPNRGYSFNTWSADPSVSFSSAATTASNSFSMPASDVALTASYNTLTSRTVTVNNDGNGSGSADLNPAYVGETVTLTATPNTGYRFVEWTTSDGVLFASSTSASTTFTMLDKNVTVQANFALVDNVIASGHANTMNDSYHDNQGSTLSGENVDADCVFDHNVFKFTYTGFGGSGKYYGMDITKDAGYNSSLSDGATGIGFYYKTEAANDGLAFCLDPKCSGGDKQYKMQLAATNGVWTYVYVAHSEADEWDGTFRFWINSNDNATVGGAATTTQQASGHFYIANISATSVTSKPSISPYTVTVQANNGSYGSVTGSGSYYGCETVSITATPNACYRFVNWTTNDGVTFGDENSASTTFDMTGSNVTVTANFEQKNLAENKTVCAGWSRKTVEINASEVPEKAVDGDLNSHHIQWAIDDNFATKGWWAVDLGDNYVLSDIKIYWQDIDAGGRAPQNYEIQAAISTPTDFEDDHVMDDATNWRTIKTVSGVVQNTGSTANVHSFTVGEHAVARYLRIVNKDTDRKVMALSEFEVYGTDTENCYAANTPTASFVGIVDGQIKLNLSATNTNGDALTNFAVLYGGVYYDVTASEGVGALTLPTHRDITVRVYAYNTCMERSTGYVDVAVGDYVNPVDNLAELKTTWVSYTNNNADEKQANLNDGILDNNGWIPYQNTGANAWMVVDLGDTYQISSVETFFATDRKSTNYKIYGRQEDPVTDDVRGDNTQWVELASKSSSINSGATESDVNESAVTYTGAIRYVRFESFAEEWADAENGFKLLEFRVFGSVFKSRDVTGPTWTDANCAVTSAVGNTITMTLEATDTHPEHVYNFTINVSDGSSNRNYERSTTAMSNEITITDAELIASCQSYTVTATCYDDAGNASTPKEFSNVVPSIVAETNLAKAKTATAGTTQGGYVAGNAIDDNNTTMWSGNYERNDGVNQWIYVNLGERYDLSKIHIRWGDNSNTWPQDYELQVSNDGSVFAPVAHYTSVSANQANDYVVSDVTAQYVRVWANKAGSTYGMEMQELKVYGDCETDTELPIMLFAEALDDDVYVTAADIYVGAIHKSIASNQLLYHVDYTDNTNGSYSGSRTITAAEVTNGRFQLDNLQSGHSYTVTIYAAKTSDIAENRSENYKTVSFTTKAIGAYSKYYMANSINGWLAVNGGEWTDEMNAWRFQNTAVNGLYRLQHTVSVTELWTYLLYDQPNALRTTPSDRKLNVTSGRDVIMTMRGLNEYVSNYHTLYIAGEAVGTAANDLTYSLTWTDATHASWTGYVTEGQNFGLIFPDPCASDANYIRTGVLDFTYSESWPYAKLTFDLDTWTCSWEEADPTECSNPGGAGSGETIAGANAFTTGYDISIKWKAAVSSSNPDSLIVGATNNDTYETSTGNIYLFFFKTKTSSEIYKEVQLATTASTVTKAIPIPSEVGADEYAYLSVKFERDSKLYITERMLYNLKGGGCSDDEYFDIYHWDDVASAPEGARTSYDGGNIVLPIRYFRHFANEDWNTITLPFEVSKVTVYDNGDKQEYDLYPRFNNGSKDVEGYYWLKTFSDEVSLGGFKSAWQQLTVTTAETEDDKLAPLVKPEKNTPYVIAFPEYAGYYRTNWVIFHGVAGQTIASDFTGDERIEELGENEEITRVKLQGNNTMHESDALSNIYMIEEGFNYFTRRELIAVPAFEAYVIGTAKVQTRYSILRYTGEEENIPDVMDQPTGIENTPPTTAGYDGEVYTVAGIRVAGFANRDEMETLLNNLGAGVYIVRMGTQINKVVVR